MTLLERSSSEPPEDINLKTGLRCGFPIKINGFSLGSQENLSDTSDIFGVTLTSRFGSGSISSASSSERRRSLRGTTPVKITGVQFVRSPSPTNDPFATPFGPVQSRRAPQGRFGAKRSFPSTQTSLESKSQSISNLSYSSSIFDASPTISTVRTNDHERSSSEKIFSNRKEEHITQHDIQYNDIQTTEPYSTQFITTESKETFEESSKISEENTKTQIVESEKKNFLLKETYIDSSVSQTPVKLQRPSHFRQTSLSGAENFSSSLVNLISQHRDQDTLSNTSQEYKSTSYSTQHNESSRSQGLSSNLEEHPPDPSFPYSCNTSSSSLGPGSGLCRNISSDKLENAISNMADKLESFKNEVTQNVRMENIDQALSNMKKTLRSLRTEPVSSGSNLDDVISNMKDTLTSIRSEVNHKTLRELNREMTPFDLPALSPVPQILEARRAKRFNVDEEMRKDLVTVERIKPGFSGSERLDGNIKSDSKKFEESRSCKYPELDPEPNSDSEDSPREYSVEARIFIKHQGQDEDILIVSNAPIISSDTPMDTQEEAEMNPRITNVEEPGLKDISSVSASTSLMADMFISSRHKTLINQCLAELEQNVNLTSTYSEISETNLEKMSETNLEQRKEQGLKSNLEQGLETNLEQKLDSSDYELQYINKTRGVQIKREEITSKEHQIQTSILEHRAEESSTLLLDGVEETETWSENQTLDDTDYETDTVKENLVKLDSENIFSSQPENSNKASIFMTEFSSDNDSYSTYYNLEKSGVERITRLDEKRSRNRTIDLHDLPSLFWAGTVKDYHERQYAITQTSGEQTDQQLDIGKEDRVACSTEVEHDGRVELAKDGLGLILKRLQNIELKLDELKTIETSILAHDTRRHSLPGRFSTIPDDTLNLTHLNSFRPENQDDYCLTRTPTGEDLQDKDELEVKKEEEECMPPGGSKERGEHKEEKRHEVSGDVDDSSTCSTPTFIDTYSKPQEVGYESDVTVYQDDHESDFDIVIDEKSDNDDSNLARWTYKPFGLDISELSDCTESEDDDPEARKKRIESLAAAMVDKDKLVSKPGFKRGELNMEIDTLSERSEEEEEEAWRKSKPQRSRRPSGRKRSMSRERNAKIRYCWRCHHAGHENWQCQEDIQPGGWCPRCLESTHWEDSCWVEQAGVLCPICSIPGHLPCVHQAADFRQRKLVIDTFGWLAFREWFQDLTFRSWWNCSGYTGVPLYKIMQRNPGQDLDLGFES